jgi:acylpyruvate hydrolase
MEMKLVRFLAGHDERLGAAEKNIVADIEVSVGLTENLIPNWNGSMRRFLEGGDESLRRARTALTTAMENPEAMYAGRALCHTREETRLLAPISDPRKIICVGQNYRDHCVEQNQPLPERPIIFAKFPNTLIGTDAPVLLPHITQQVDYEAELAFIIGKKGHHIPLDQSRSYVAGYMCLNDISARDIQFADKQWVRGKTFDTFAPCGPWMVTEDEIPDPGVLNISLTLNGTVMQQSNTSNLIFGIDFLIHNLSEVMTLEAGDIVTTGTPGGVGVWRKPQVFLKAGDIMTVEIEKIGKLSNPAVNENRK